MDDYIPFFNQPKQSTQTFPRILFDPTPNISIHKLTNHLIYSFPSSHPYPSQSPVRNVVRRPSSRPTHGGGGAAHEAAPHGPLLRPPRKRKPHHQSLQAHLCRCLRPPLPNRHHIFHPVAQPTPPPPQILRPSLLHSGSGPGSRLRKFPDYLQRYCAELQPKHRCLL